MEIVKKAVDELAEHKFSGEINFGENGDALLNPYFKDIIEYAYANLPLTKFVLYTNMMYVDKDMSEFLLKHNLSRLILNIDGASEQTYGYSKPGLDFYKVKANLHDFINARNKSGNNCKICIEILSPKRYMKLRKNRKQIDLPYDSNEVIKYWQSYLSEKDSVDEIIWFYNWDNRSNENRRNSCPSGILSEAFFDKMFISSEGDAYICCLDYNTKLTYGNVLENSIYSLWGSDKRHQIIKDIINKRFEKIGEPCIYCNTKLDYLTCYSDFIKHRYIVNAYAIDGNKKV
jgi:MoaA/NifB/PqqE/SkfB family radical SAM enzyme